MGANKSADTEIFNPNSETVHPVGFPPLCKDLNNTETEPDRFQLQKHEKYIHKNIRLVWNPELLTLEFLN